MSIDVDVTDGIATVTINRPERMNAMDAEHYKGLSQAWMRVRDDATIRVAIITGAGEKSFSSGADFKSFLTAPAGLDDPRHLGVAQGVDCRHRRHAESPDGAGVPLLDLLGSKAVRSQRLLHAERARLVRERPSTGGRPEHRSPWAQRAPNRIATPRASPCSAPRWNDRPSFARRAVSRRRT